MTRTQKAAVEEFLQRTGLAATFRFKPPTAQDFMASNNAEFGDCDRKDTRWTSADFEIVQNLALRRPSARQRFGRWLRNHTLGAYLRWEQTAVQDPATGLFLILGVFLPVAFLVFVTVGLALTHL
ncbi:hypothetical protein [Streptomyces sp. AC1-42T]|uniref:hypothetical protein n=1 Tax=Streptomyces sp. AC1-42T TaxID=2218665 RepID=UPI000DAE9255|nr:hypothetical protein [Streptomyces sp. AC1-42T]PZT71546.1 hypothetical protein DNK55_33090 [Streptomyces sp. AC1-42T]